MRVFRTVSLCVIVAFAAAATSIGTRAYSTFGSWGSSPAVMYINPENADVTSSAAEAAVVAAMDVWNTQGGTPFRFIYGGRVSDTAFGHDGKSVILFRNESNGSTIGTSYAWSSNGQLVESDVVFWDGGFQFFTGTSGCSGGMYVEDVASHELGHSAGLNHSEYPDATMYPVASSYCSQQWRTLAPDDIAGLQSLYGTTAAVTNTAPSVSIGSPASGSSFVEGSAITFSGSATDAQDGNLTSSIVWRSSVDGTLRATGTGFSYQLSPGSHTITASVTDSGGKSAAATVGITVTAAVTAPTPPSPPPPTGATLSVRAYKIKGLQKADLTWSGLSATSVTVFRGGSAVTTLSNSGTYTDPINRKGSGSYIYKVCAAGTSTCTNDATAAF
jgi:hypothetical protein